MTAKELMKILEKNGWKYKSSRGSHYYFEKDGKKIPVPFHGNTDIKNLAKRILKQAGIEE